MVVWHWFSAHRIVPLIVVDLLTKANTHSEAATYSSFFTNNYQNWRNPQYPWNRLYLLNYTTWPFFIKFHWNFSPTSTFKIDSKFTRYLTNFRIYAKVKYYKGIACKGRTHYKAMRPYTVTSCLNFGQSSSVPNNSDRFS